MVRREAAVRSVVSEMVFTRGDRQAKQPQGPSTGRVSSQGRLDARPTSELASSTPASEDETETDNFYR